MDMKRTTERTEHGIRVGDVEYTEPKELVLALMMLADYEDAEMDPHEYKENVDYVLELNKRLRPFFHKFSADCKYRLEIPNVPEMCCDAYSQSKRPDGRHWSHYPECAGKNCPLLYPYLLQGAVLENTDEKKENE